MKEIVTDILINKLKSDKDIHLDLQGEGVKRQIWFALIKSGALVSISSGIKIKNLYGPLMNLKHTYILLRKDNSLKL